jgi:hypothetical protein
MRGGTRILVTCAASSLLAASGGAQELSPRAYWPAPKGSILTFVGYNHSSGDVITDPSLPIVGVDSRLNTVQVGYLQTVSLFGRTSNVVVELPYTWGSTEGTVDGEPARRDLSAVGDMAFTLSVNLLGAPSLTRAEFRELRQNPHPILGASVRVLAPTGSYDPDKLINVGANRWAVKAELGSIFPLNPPWHLEFEVGAWFFGDNDRFLGAVREQRPVLSLEAHLVRRFRPGFWASLDGNFFAGGRNVIDGEPTDTLQRNSRLGLTVVFPFRRRHALKASYSTGVVTESGGNYRSFVLSYNLLLR